MSCYVGSSNPTDPRDSELSIRATPRPVGGNVERFTSTT